MKIVKSSSIFIFLIYFRMKCLLIFCDLMIELSEINEQYCAKCGTINVNKRKTKWIWIASFARYLKFCFHFPTLVLSLAANYANRSATKGF